MEEVRGTILDVINRRIYNGAIEIRDGRIHTIHETDDVPRQFIIPGFVDSHIHIESTMLVPSEFARAAVRHGTVATVSDPHEIANVCGLEGIDFMIDNGNQVPFKFYFGAPSCVPATPHETAGAALTAGDVADLLDRDDIHYLSEMMNWPGVLNGDEEVAAKIRAALSRGKPVDGHAPGLKGERAAAYARAGITTDHECVTREEAEDKIRHGMLIAIREGSAARNYEALLPLLGDHPGKVMFCSDDLHPDDLLRGHMNTLAATALTRGHELFDLLYAFCVLPVKHYNMDVGLLQTGDPADMAVVADPETMLVNQTWIDGICVFDRGVVNFPDVEVKPVNNFVEQTLASDDFRVPASGEKQPVIVPEEGEIITGMSYENLPERGGYLQTDPERDLLKITVVNRYKKARPSVGFIRNFGIKGGAIASSVAHDSHNVIAVGSSDRDISRAVNLVMKHHGAIVAVTGDQERVLPLPVAGLMSDRSAGEVAIGYEDLNDLVRQMGSTLQAPFMTLSFMALLVIPTLKISDRGMFNGETFEFIN